MLTKISTPLIAALIVLMLLPTVALAEDYTLPIIVDGQSYTLTVSVDDGNIAVTASSPDIEVGDLVAVETQPAASAPSTDSLTCTQILDNQRQMTRAQWLKYIETGVKTQQIVDWQGKIVEVGGKGLVTLGEYPIQIEVSPGCRIYYTEADEETALNYRQGQKVTINGTITDLVVLLGTLTLYVDDDAFTITQSAASNSTSTYTTLDGDGFYTVGTEIEVGLWETEDGYSTCYWALLDANQETLKNHFGVSGGVINIPATVQELEIRGCGALTQISPEYLQDKSDAALMQEPKDDGFYLIGVEIAPGVWETENGRDSCYWALLDDNQETLKNHFGPSGGTINLTENNYELEIKNCGTLSPVSIDQSNTQPANTGGEATTESTNPSTSAGATANRNANLRSGPGTNYAVSSSVQTGQALQIVAKNSDGTWFMLDSGQWIAAFLVNNAPTDLPIETGSAPPEAAPVQAASIPAPAASPPSTWRDMAVQTCNHFEWRIADVRHTKEVWHYSDKTVAQGEYLLVYIEIKNVSPGTSDLESSSAPRLNGRSYDFDPTWDAAWMMTGGHNVTWNDYNPGSVISVVAGFDVQPSNSHVFSMANCGQSVNIGAWDELIKGAIKASSS